MNIAYIDRNIWYGQATIENLPAIAQRFRKTLEDQCFSIVEVQTPAYDQYAVKLHSGTRFKRTSRYSDLFIVRIPAQEEPQLADFAFFAGKQYWYFETTLHDADVQAQPYTEKGLVGGFHISFQGDDIVTRRSFGDGTETIRIFKLVEMSEEDE